MNETRQVVEWVVAPEQVSDAERVMAIGREHGWDFRIAGRGKLLTSPWEHESGWTLVPLDQDNSIIPVDALQRLKVIGDDGVRYVGIIIGHEPPVIEGEVQEINQSLILTPPEPRRSTREVASEAAKSAAKVGIEAAKVGGKIVIGTTMLMGALAAGAVSMLTLADPIMIIVLDDEERTWVQIIEWYL